MTELLYYQDAYIKEFVAVIVAQLDGENPQVWHRTAFYPGGGGQPNDEGWLEVDGIRTWVSKVKKQEGDHLAYTLDQWSCADRRCRRTRLLYT